MTYIGLWKVISHSGEIYSLASVCKLSQVNWFGTVELESIWEPPELKKRVLSVMRILRVKPSKVEKEIRRNKKEAEMG